jgi:hypothetical protein
MEKKNMKKQILKTLGGASLAILALTVITQVWVLAQDKDSQSFANGQTLVGSWNLEVTLRDCETGTPFVTFPAMNTYNQGGTTQQAALPPEPGAAALPGHGVWSHKNGRGYTGAFQFFALNPNPALITRVIVRSDISLALGGNSYTSTDAAEIRALDGTVVGIGCSTTVGTRFE